MSAGPAEASKIAKPDLNPSTSQLPHPKVSSGQGSLTISPSFDGCQDEQLLVGVHDLL